MNPRIRHSHSNENAHHDQNSDPRFLSGNRYHRYENSNASRNHDKWSMAGRMHSDFRVADADNYEGENLADLREPLTQRESRTRDGAHAGKGRKFYRRSGAGILEEVNEILTRHSHVDASKIVQNHILIPKNSFDAPIR